MNWSSWGVATHGEEEPVEEPVQEANRRIEIVTTVAGFSILVAILVAIGVLASFMLGLT